MERQLGRESQKDNDLFYTCSLIDYIARKTKNKVKLKYGTFVYLVNGREKQ